MSSSVPWNANAVSPAARAKRSTSPAKSGSFGSARGVAASKAVAMARADLPQKEKTARSAARSRGSSAEAATIGT